MYQLSASEDGKKLAFSSLYKSSFNIFLLNNPFESELDVNELPLTKYRQGKLNLDAPPLELLKEENESSKDSTDFNPSKFFASNDSTKKYGDSITVDFGNYVFGTEQVAVSNEEKSDTLGLIDNLDERGNFKINKYKINFAPDLVYANAGYSTLYGLIGTTVISFSDFTRKSSSDWGYRFTN